MLVVLLTEIFVDCQRLSHHVGADIVQIIHVLIVQFKSHKSQSAVPFAIAPYLHRHHILQEIIPSHHSQFH